MHALVCAVAVAAAVGGAPAVVGQTPAAAAASADRGAPCDQDAESAARRSLAQTAAANGGESVETAAATDVVVGVLLRNGKGARPETLALAQRAVRIKEARLGPGATDLAPSLRNLARGPACIR